MTNYAHLCIKKQALFYLHIIGRHFNDAITPLQQKKAKKSKKTKKFKYFSAFLKKLFIIIIYNSPLYEDKYS